MELKASRSRDAEAVVVEARLVQGQGPVATIVAKRGTLRAGQPIVVGNEWGKVRKSVHTAVQQGSNTSCTVYRLMSGALTRRWLCTAGARAAGSARRPAQGGAARAAG
jgi:hypothetical protein